MRHLVGFHENLALPKQVRIRCSDVMVHDTLYVLLPMLLNAIIYCRTEIQEVTVHLTQRDESPLTEVSEEIEQ